MPSSLPRWDRRRLTLLAGEFCDRGLPHPFAGSAPTLNVSRPARRSLALRPVGSRSRPRRPSPSKASAAALPRRLLRLLPAGATPCRTGFSPAEDHHLFTAHKGDIHVLCLRVKHKCPFFRFAPSPTAPEPTTKRPKVSISSRGDGRPSVGRRETVGRPFHNRCETVGRRSCQTFHVSGRLKRLRNWKLSATPMTPSPSKSNPAL